MSAIRDISDRKRIEHVLHEKNLELIAAAEIKNRFLANMSHELRTPLNGIIGFAEFLVDGRPGPLKPKQREYLEDILSSGRHLLQLINDILDLAKVESGKMELIIESVAIGKIVEQVCAVAKPLAHKKGVTMVLNISDDLPAAILDAQKLKQILYNLVSNAIKFSEQAATVEIAAFRQGPENFILTVRDSGIGIKEEDLSRLFKEFEQLESGAGRHYEGTGLGLALTKKLVELHGGTISVESEVGKGSIFTVALPLVTREPAK